MDPEETLRLAAAALARGERDEAKEYLGYYADWRGNGGFQPPGGDAKAASIAQGLRRKRKAASGPKFRLYQVPLNQGGYEYGKYGRYYGRGEPLYRLEDEEGEIEEFRAPSRAAAKERARAKKPGARFFRGLAGAGRKKKCRYGKITRGKRKGQCRARPKRRR